MIYRDELAPAHARIAELERELAKSREKPQVPSRSAIAISLIVDAIPTIVVVAFAVTVVAIIHVIIIGLTGHQQP